MATLTVLKFNDPYGADRVRDALEVMHEQQIIILKDEAVVTWPLGDKKPLFPQEHLMGEMPLGGAFWGFLLGLIFAVPVLGAAIGAGAAAALSSSMEDEGIDEDFIKRVGENVTEGTSALFTLTSEGKLDEVVDELKQYDFEIISTNLSTEQEKKLREAFAQE